MKSSPGQVSLLLSDLQQGKADAASKLMPLVYGELRRLAAHYLRQESPGHTLQPTALVHEVYLKLVEQGNASWQSRAHFFGIASRLMREILVEHARKRRALKRGGLQQKVQLAEALAVAPNRPIELVALDEALRRLEKLDPQQSRIVELRFFGGLSIEETAEVLGVASRTVKRDWSVARVWLHREIAKGGQE
jgi:RNA polymerase sigma-70 factor (ECF subfamily)